MRAALDALPDEQRTVVEGAYFGGLTLREIAEREGLPLGTVKSRLRLAMEKLTEAMRARAVCMTHDEVRELLAGLRARCAGCR